MSKIEKTQIPEFDLKGIGNCNSVIFSRKIINSGILSINNKSAIISFQRIQPGDFLLIEDLAVLALIIRKLAERGGQVIINWSKPYKGRISRIQKMLERIKFADLFSQDYNPIRWKSNIKIIGRSIPSSIRMAGPDKARYISMRWVDIDSFGVNPKSDLWKVRPEVPDWTAKDLTRLLQLQGFLSPEIIDLMLHTLFMEVAWNIILHSQEQPGTGYGIFCGQVIHPSSSNNLQYPQLSFCLSDLGRGIPASLGGFYDSTKDNKRKYHEIECVSRNSGIVRFALDRDSTSRPYHVSEIDAEGCRGLAYVINSIKDKGYLWIRSEGGSVKASGESTVARAELSDEFYDCPLPGTQVVGTLNAHSSIPRHIIKQTSASDYVPSSIEHLTDHSGNYKLKLPEDVNDFLSKMHKLSPSVPILDAGCANITARQFEYLCKGIVNFFPNKIFAIWNCRIEWTLLQGLSDWLKEKRKERLGAIIIAIKSCDDGMILGVDELELYKIIDELHQSVDWIHLVEDVTPSSISSIGVPITVAPVNSLRISQQTNSAILNTGFDAPMEANGFYTGRIHLLTGPVVERFFSFAMNVRGKPANSERWLRSAKDALKIISEKLNKKTRNGIVLLGFTGTVIDLLQRIGRESYNDFRVYIVLTYDLPSTDEIRSVIHPSDNVVLVTDVISSGSSARMLAGAIQNIGATPVAAITLVDARRGPYFGTDKLDIGNKNIPLYSCGSAEIIEKKLHAQEELFHDEFWVDPISLIPTKTRSPLWDVPENLSKRIDFTLNAISDANAAKCGHCVDGTRHMSTYIDMHLLLSNALPIVFDYLKHGMYNVLKERGWADFNPSHIIFPSGISRIQSLNLDNSYDQTETNVTVYGTSVLTYIVILKSIFTNMQEVEIPRSFDPGGNSRCSVLLDNLTDSPNTPGDIIIADDGVWSGRTMNSILRGAIESGGQRVFVVPLLARFMPNELIYWESFRSVKSERTTSEIPVCFYFPLIYPVPAYSSQECPYENMNKYYSKQIEMVKSMTEIFQYTTNKSQAKIPSEMPLKDKEYSEVWVRLRCYLELASESESSLEKALSILRGRTSIQEKSAILELLINEHQIIYRSRVRHAFVPALLEFIEGIFIDINTNSNLLLLALDALRYLFINDFVKQIDTLTKFCYRDIAFLERCLFHIATLDDPLRLTNNCKRFLERVSQADTNFVNQIDPDVDNRYRETAVFARSCLLYDQLDEKKMVNAEHSFIYHAEYLLNLLVEDHSVQHIVRPTLNNLFRGRRNLATCSTDVWSALYTRWREKIEPLITDKILPHIHFIKDVLIRTATPDYEFVPFEADYLISNKTDRKQNIAKDIAGIRFGLDYLSKKRSSSIVDSTAERAKRIWKAICGERIAITECLSSDILSNEISLSNDKLCILGKLLLEIRSYSVAIFIQKLTDEIKTILDSHGINCEIPIKTPDRLKLDSFLFLPKAIVSEAITRLTANISNYAFPIDVKITKPAKIEISIQYDDSDHTTHLLSLIVRDNGINPKAEMVQNRGGKILNSAMEIFGGAFPGPSKSHLTGWSTEQHFRSKLWLEDN